MRLLSVNLGELRTLSDDGPPRASGIFKRPASGPVELTAAGLAGDVIVSKKYHGGPDQAVYVYGEPDYAWWSGELGRELAPGTFGDNLTVAGFESATAWIGDRLVIGNVVLEISAPRIPCGNLGARMEDPTFPRKFRMAERPGVYCRVVHDGYVEAGSAVVPDLRHRSGLSVIGLYRDHYEPARTVADIERILAAPIAARWRTKKEKQRRALLETGVT